MQSSPNNSDDGEIPIEPVDNNDIRYTPDPVDPPQKKKSIAIPAVLGVAALAGHWPVSQISQRGQARRGGGWSRQRPAPHNGACHAGSTAQSSRLALTGQLKSNQDVNINSKIRRSGRARLCGRRPARRARTSSGFARYRRSEPASRFGARNLASEQVKLDQARVGFAGARGCNQQRRARGANAGEFGSGAFATGATSQPTTATNARSQVESAKAAVSSNQARVRQARDTLKQVTGQVNSGVASAQAALNQARAQLQQVKNCSRDQQILQAGSAGFASRSAG